MGKIREIKFHHIYFLKIFFPFVLVGKQNFGPPTSWLSSLGSCCMKKKKKLFKKRRGKAEDNTRNQKNLSPLRGLVEVESFRQKKQNKIVLGKPEASERKALY